jgi:glucoamylase
MHRLRALRRLVARPAFAVLAILLLATGVAAIAGRASGSRVPRLLVGGVAQDPCRPSHAAPVRPAVAGRFEPGSSVLLSGSGAYVGLGKVTPLTTAESACATATVRADRAWLRAGTVPGTSASQRGMASRALLDLRLAVQADGAVVAGWHDGWVYAWPRDSSWVAVALADTGHSSEAWRVLRFLAEMQAPDGTWATRYQVTGAGPVAGRAAELDAVGWLPWAVWGWYTAVEPQDPRQAEAGLRTLWPMVTRAADAAAGALSADGLPRPAMDYWEDSTGQTTIETAAALEAGLRSAADLAPAVGALGSGRHWAAAARRLTSAIGRTYGRSGYQRTPDGGGADAAVTLLGPPFAPSSLPVRRAAAATVRSLRQPNGGLRPGQDWPGPAGIAWTPETAFFALFDAATGQSSAANRVLNWLSQHRSKLGELPEQVNQLGDPSSVAPLSWTDAIVLLTLVAQEHRLLTVPVPMP